MKPVTMIKAAGICTLLALGLAIIGAWMLHPIAGIFTAALLIFVLGYALHRTAKGVEQLTVRDPRDLV